MRDDSRVSEAIEFRAVHAGESPASDLIEAMVDELEEHYGRIDRPGMPSATPADFSPPGGICLVGFDGERPLCVGAVKRLDDRACEIKRMFVAPAGRSRGLARLLLAALEDAARELGYEIARLDTGPEQPHAQALYESAGYAPIHNFNANLVASFWGEKRL